MNRYAAEADSSPSVQKDGRFVRVRRRVLMYQNAVGA